MKSPCDVCNEVYEKCFKPEPTLHFAYNVSAENEQNQEEQA